MLYLGEGWRWYTNEVFVQMKGETSMSMIWKDPFDALMPLRETIGQRAAAESGANHYRIITLRYRRSIAGLIWPHPQAQSFESYHVKMG